MKRILFGLLLCLNACTFYVRDELNLTILNDGMPVADYEITVKRLEESAMQATRPEHVSDDDILWTLGTYKTDANGVVTVTHDFITDNRRLTRKPMFFISSRDINTCYIVPWYLEKEKVFIPMIFKDGDFVGAPANLDDMRGDFEKSQGMGWTINAVINDMTNICQPK